MTEACAPPASASSTARMSDDPLLRHERRARQTLQRSHAAVNRANQRLAFFTDILAKPRCPRIEASRARLPRRALLADATGLIASPSPQPRFPPPVGTMSRRLQGCLVARGRRHRRARLRLWRREKQASVATRARRRGALRASAAGPATRLSPAAAPSALTPAAAGSWR